MFTRFLHEKSISDSINILDNDSTSDLNHHLTLVFSEECQMDITHKILLQLLQLSFLSVGGILERYKK